MPKRSTADRSRCRGIEARTIAFLERYDCPTPYHAVCTHFLGAMSGSAPVRPMKVLAKVWDAAGTARCQRSSPLMRSMSYWRH